MKSTSVATWSSICIGAASNLAWYHSDKLSWSSFGWIVLALLTLLIGLVMEVLVWIRLDGRK